MNSVEEVQSESINRYRFFVLFLLCGISIFVIPIFLLGGIKTIYLICIPSIYLLIVLSLNRSKNLEQYFSIFFIFFIASLVYSLDIIITGEGLPASIEGIVLEKLLETILVVIPILLLFKFSGNELDSLYLKTGKLKLGLIIGVSTLLFFLITSVEVSMLLFGAQDVTAENVISWSSWIMIFVFSNGLKEELLYRGLFLRKYESYLGEDTANFLQALIFTLAHLGSQYTPELLIFAVITFFLGLGFGAVMQKTDSILGSILCHAGADIPVVIAYFSII